MPIANALSTKNTTANKISTWITNHLTRVSFDQKILFVHNLYIMIKAGLSLVAALKILAEQITNKRLQIIISEIKEQIEKGRQLSDVLADYPAVFPPIYVSMIGAGEVAGKMEESLRQVVTQMKKSRELYSKIRGALIYPAVVLTAMVGIGIQMVVFVLPKLLIMFDDIGAELPLSTKILIKIVRFTQNHGLFLALAIIVIIALLIWLVRQPKIKRLVHRGTLHLPIAGIIIKKINLASFTLTLSSLLESTIPIIDAVRITGSVQTNITYREALIHVSEALKKGTPLSETLAVYPNLFTPMVVQMIMVGEESGQVDQMLRELSEFYGNEVDNTMKNFSTIVEPVIILIMGVAVAALAVSVIMPMYSLAQNF